MIWDSIYSLFNTGHHDISQFLFLLLPTDVSKYIPVPFIWCHMYMVYYISYNNTVQHIIMRTLGNIHIPRIIGDMHPWPCSFPVWYHNLPEGLALWKSYGYPVGREVIVNKSAYMLKYSNVIHVRIVSFLNTEMVQTTAILLCGRKSLT